MNNIQMPVERESRKFEGLNNYSANPSNGYFLLPFRFHRLNKQKEILVNETGDFLLVPIGTAEAIITRQFSKEKDDELYGDLVANFFISEEQIPPLLDVISTRYGPKKSFLDYFTALHIFVITLRCEHTCHYCQVSRVSEDKRVFDMKRDHIDKSIEFMMKSPNPNVTMEFQGGEALLAFNNVAYAIEKTKVEAAKRGKNVTYVICTTLPP